MSSPFFFDRVTAQKTEVERHTGFFSLVLHVGGGGGGGGGGGSCFLKRLKLLQSKTWYTN